MKNFSIYVVESQLDTDDCLLKLKLESGIFVYITFNSYNEYSYQIQFSFNNIDRERFDNYDKNWKVSTAPHHFHSRFTKDVTDSSMNGNPEHDIPLLIQFLKKYL